eukprot:TRINITY_DN115_c0_g1_i1.p1 TRINITY_DN115_c0_g1~~TRINITY_DN115_c0_g1_i1.p1  ORF type:complete len:215 (+),score=15.64 TRINITY_DN115_c0_g1_i1:215-859(+)
MPASRCSRPSSATSKSTRASGVVLNGVDNVAWRYVTGQACPAIRARHWAQVVGSELSIEDDDVGWSAASYVIALHSLVKAEKIVLRYLGDVALPALTTVSLLYFYRGDITLGALTTAGSLAFEGVGSLSLPMLESVDTIVVYETSGARLDFPSLVDVYADVFLGGFSVVNTNATTLNLPKLQFADSLYIYGNKSGGFQRTRVSSTTLCCLIFHL